MKNNPKRYTRWMGLVLAAALGLESLPAFANQSEELADSAISAAETASQENPGAETEKQEDNTEDDAETLDSDALDEEKDAPADPDQENGPAAGVWIHSEEDLESDEAAQADYLIVQAMTAWDSISTVFDAVLQKAAEQNIPVIAVVSASIGSADHRALEAANTLTDFVQGRNAKVIPAVVLEEANVQTGPKYVMDFLELYQTRTGICGYGISDGAVRESTDWSGYPAQYGLLFTLDEMQPDKAELNEHLAAPAEMDETEVLYRMYNPNSGEHFYTLDSTEAANLLNWGWYNESIAWTTPNEGEAVYRLYNSNDGGDHHYTSDPNEKEMLINAGWKYEGIAFNSDAGRTQPVYRAYNRNQKVNNHNFTPDEEEQQTLIEAGWKDEGIGFYGAEDWMARRQVKGGNYILNDHCYNLNQVMVKGVQKVSGRLYYFNQDGSQLKGQGIVSADNGRKVYLNADNSLKTGLISLPEGTYYFDYTGFMAANTYVNIGDLTYHFNAQGLWDNLPDVEVQKECNKVYARLGKNLKTLYDYCRSTTYVALPIPLAPPAGWTREQNYAMRGLRNRAGNCYCYAAAFAALARNLGYEAKLIEGRTLYADGSYGPHGWCEIKVNGAWYICDPQLEYLHPNISFYMQPIGSPKAYYRY